MQVEVTSRYHLTLRDGTERTPRVDVGTCTQINYESRMHEVSRNFSPPLYKQHLNSIGNPFDNARSVPGGGAADWEWREFLVCVCVCVCSVVWCYFELGISLHNHFNALKDETHPWQRAHAPNCMVILDCTAPLEAASLDQRYVLTPPVYCSRRTEHFTALVSSL